MTHGWTGAQYSLYRAAFGVYLASHFAGLVQRAASPGATLVGALGLLLAFAFALGLRDRIAALALCGVWAFVEAPSIRAEPRALVPSLLLLAHVFTRGRPWGALDARRDSDPRGDWRLPPWVHAAGWIVLGVTHGLTQPARLALAPFALLPRFRPWVWLALVALSFLHRAEPSLGLWLLNVFTFDPAWLPPRRDASPATLGYDGECGLCHRAVRFVLAEDRDGRGFRFAPLASDAFHRLVPAPQRVALPDSLVLVTADGRVRTRSAALREIGFRLGGVWRALAQASALVPIGLLDRGYDLIAAMRSRMFAKPADVCPILPGDLRKRFL
ncbi:MAG TPA: DCC1-like thiol-disulfide oxidoreductase family protein [Myxococcota bacterium]|nr:DCC1-like thiol-disulfide oxidoreductase family protein [Myxococcota bacterium]